MELLNKRCFAKGEEIRVGRKRVTSDAIDFGQWRGRHDIDYGRCYFKQEPQSLFERLFRTEVDLDSYVRALRVIVVARNVIYADVVEDLISHQEDREHFLDVVANRRPAACFFHFVYVRPQSIADSFEFGSDENLERRVRQIVGVLPCGRGGVDLSIKRVRCGDDDFVDSLFAIENVGLAEVQRFDLLNETLFVRVKTIKRVLLQHHLDLRCCLRRAVGIGDDSRQRNGE
ncbi:hypothetical protein PQR46_36625 [Paraburkholderia sediminicola]|uniref:hypothetical protein n=1 Tax=Paraburkholderia TaxID=1822464 RepID=UPI0038BA6470